MDLVTLIGTLAAGGIASLVMSWLEGRRLRKPRGSDEVADNAAAVVAQEAIDALSAAQEVDESAAVAQMEESIPPVHPAPPQSAPASPPPPPPYISDEDRLAQSIGYRLANDPQFRAALGLKKKTRGTWVMQGIVSAALLAVSIWAFATNTETGVGFAFCGSLGGFWMREITA
jgi:hypothetical protein